MIYVATKAISKLILLLFVYPGVSNNPTESQPNVMTIDSMLRALCLISFKTKAELQQQARGEACGDSIVVALIHSVRLSFLLRVADNAIGARTIALSHHLREIFPRRYNAPWHCNLTSAS